VAGILRSFHYAAATAARASGGNRWESAWMSAWHRTVSAGFRDAYFERMSASRLLPVNGADRNRALDFFLLEKCLYELGYELDNRPDWVAVPMAGLKQLAEEGPPEAQA
jgi:maltose alpha-D-glucosyltransferase/alpha-amylase